MRYMGELSTPVVLTLALLMAAGVAADLVMEIVQNRAANKKKVRAFVRIAVIFLAGFLTAAVQYEFAHPHILENIYYTIRLFLGDGRELKLAAIPDWLDAYYEFVYYLTCIVAVACTAITIVSYFENLFNHLKLFFLARMRRAHIYIFSEFNDQSEAIAAGICADHEADLALHGKHPSPRLLLVFCDVNSGNGEDDIHGMPDDAIAAYAMCFREGVQELYYIIEKYMRRRNMRALRQSRSDEAGEKHALSHLHMFLLRAEESINISTAIAVAENEKKASANYRLHSESHLLRNRMSRWLCLLPVPIHGLLVHVFSTGEADGRIVDKLNAKAVDKGENTFFFVRMDLTRMLAHKVVEENCLVDTTDPDKDLHVLIVGAGKDGLAILKTLVWYYQRRAGSITVHVCDINDKVEDALWGEYPALLSGCNHTADNGDAAYNIRFAPASDIFGRSFAAYFQTLPPLDAIFITMGDDRRNAQAAMHLRRLYDRLYYETIYAAPEKLVCRIFAIVHSDRMAQNLHEIEDMGIRFVGSDGEVLQYSTIYSPDVEMHAAAAHVDRGTGIEHYRSSEYNRLSSIAEAMHLRFVAQLYGDKLPPNEEMDRICGNRWNAYMRATGWIPSMGEHDLHALWKGEATDRRRKWPRGKWHASIANYYDKCRAEQECSYTVHQSKDNHPDISASEA